MYCNNCGKSIREGSASCDNCGAKANIRSTNNNSVISRVNGAGAGIRKPMANKNIKLLIPVIACVFIVFAFIMIITMAVVSHNSHNLEGTYRCNSDMMFTSFTFTKDGKVTATYDYCTSDDMYGAVYTGKYKKSGGKYVIHLTENNLSGGSSLTQFYNDNVDDMYDIYAKKNGDNSLEISISGKLAYLENYDTYYKTY